MLKICESDIKWMTRHHQDPLGLVFRYGKRIFRIINKEKENWIIDLFDTGIIAESVNNGFLINTWICKDVELSGYEGYMLLEHTYVDYITYENEWSYQMFYDAAKLVIDYNLFLCEKGYELFDPSPGNVMFCGCRPIYVDLGSIERCESSNLSNILIINNSWLRPLKLLRKTKGDHALMQAILYCSKFDINRYELVAGNNILRKCIDRTLAFIFDIDNRIIYAKSQSENKKLQKLQKGIKKFYRVDYEKIINKKKKLLYKCSRELSTLKGNRVTEYWSNYHDGLVTDDGHIKTDKRIIYYSDIIRKMQESDSIESVFEIAGNSGAISQSFIENGLIKRACVSDYDDGAIDKGFIRCKENNAVNKKLSFAVIDLMDFREIGRETKRFRFSSDILLALAVTHHLILDQKVRMNILVDYFYQYTNRYVITEFMPLGLYDGKSEIHEEGVLPEWYTLEWFIEKMKRKFTVLSVEEIQTNRIAVIAEKKTDI